MTDQPYHQHTFTAAEPLRNGQWVRAVNVAGDLVESCSEEVALGFVMEDAREGERVRVRVTRWDRVRV